MEYLLLSRWYCFGASVDQVVGSEGDLTRSKYRNPLTHVDLCQQRNDERVPAVSKYCIKEGEVWTSRVLQGKAVGDAGDVGDVRVKEAARRTLYLGGVIMPRLAMILDLPISIGYGALFT